MTFVEEQHDHVNPETTGMYRCVLQAISTNSADKVFMLDQFHTKIKSMVNNNGNNIEFWKQYSSCLSVNQLILCNNQAVAD